MSSPVGLFTTFGVCISNISVADAYFMLFCSCAFQFDHFNLPSIIIPSSSLVTILSLFGK